VQKENTVIFKTSVDSLHEGFAIRLPIPE
jgi:hypothetical protein